MSSLALAKLEAQTRATDSMVCVGLDPDLDRFPTDYREAKHPLFAFCRAMADTTAPFCAAFKPNTAFFEAHGTSGWEQLSLLCEHIRREHPQHFLIVDAKRADIGNTNRGYVAAILDGLGADAITLHPYLGAEALAPVLERDDRAAVVLCRTSNPGAGELQDLVVEGKPLWEVVASRVAQHWNGRGNCMLVVGATWPDEMRRIRAIAPAMPFLVPGVGAQGGDLEAAVTAGVRQDGYGLLLSSSRSILYGKEPARAAQQMRDQIRSAQERAHGRR